MASQESHTRALPDFYQLIDAQRSLAVNFHAASPDQARSLRSKTLLVTGGASGLGEAFATAFAKQPQAAVIIADRDALKGKSVERSLNEAGHVVKFIQVDVADWNSVTNLFAESLRWLSGIDKGRTIDHVICSAGLEGEQLDLDPVDPEEFLEGRTEARPPNSLSIQVSVIGTLYTVSAAMRYGLGLHRLGPEMGDKSITLLASLAGYLGMYLRSDYTASKWGVRGLFRSLLDDSKAASCPVRINLLAPYFVATPLTAHLVPYMHKIGIKLAELDDVQVAAMRLMSDESIHGRAVGVWQGGPIDLGDDFGGGFGSDALRQGVEAGALVRSSTFVSQKRAKQ